MTIFDRTNVNRTSSESGRNEDQSKTLNLSQFVLTDRSYQDYRLIPETTESLEPMRALCDELKQAYYKAHEIEVETAARIGASATDLRQLAADVPTRDRFAARRRVMDFLENEVFGHTGLFLDFVAYAVALDRFVEGEERTVAERRPGRKPVPVGLTPQYVTHNLGLITAEQAATSSNKEQRVGCLKILNLLSEETRALMPEVSDAIRRMSDEVNGNR
jgi:hypothetical protein